MKPDAIGRSLVFLPMTNVRLSIVSTCAVVKHGDFKYSNRMRLSIKHVFKTLLRTTQPVDEPLQRHFG